MDLKNIFNRNAGDQVAVPQIEVHGEEMEVNNTGDEENREEQNRKFKLPKTKWFCPMGDGGDAGEASPFSSTTET
jgi:hypothetical protein